jgi:hypothetical protein
VTKQQVCQPFFPLVPPNLITVYCVGVNGWARFASTNQPSQAESNFGDGSGPLFTIYSKIAEKDDNKRVERWQRDALGILIFVSPHFAFCVAPCVNGKTLDRPLLYRRRDIGHHVRPGPQTTLTG